MRRREYPDVSIVIDRDHGIVVRIVCLLVQQYGRTGNGFGCVVEVRNHMQKLSVIVRRCAAIAEESLVRLRAIDGKGFVFRAVRSKPATVLVDILVARGLVHVPNATIPIGLLVQRDGGLDWLTAVAASSEPINKGRRQRIIHNMIVGRIKERSDEDANSGDQIGSQSPSVCTLPTFCCGSLASRDATDQPVTTAIHCECNKSKPISAIAGSTLDCRKAIVTESQLRRGERGIWQPRFWEHTVRDESDLERCSEYIHWNPRKHCLVDRVADWQWSSFHRFVSLVQYNIDWGGVAPPGMENSDDWGEPATERAMIGGSC